MNQQSVELLTRVIESEEMALRQQVGRVEQLKSQIAETENLIILRKEAIDDFKTALKILTDGIEA